MFVILKADMLLLQRGRAWRQPVEAIVQLLIAEAEIVSTAVARAALFAKAAFTKAAVRRPFALALLAFSFAVSRATFRITIAVALAIAALVELWPPLPPE